MRKAALILLSYDDRDYFGSHQKILTDMSAISRLHLHHRVSWIMTSRVTRRCSTFPQKVGCKASMEPGCRLEKRSFEILSYAMSTMHSLVFISPR